MCQFFSAIVTKDSILYDKNIDQHEILIRNYNLDDTTLTPEFVRVELTPPESNNVFEKDLTKWNFNTDQDLIPTWYNEDAAKERTIKALSNIYSEIVFENVKDLIIKEGRVFLKNSSAILYHSSSAILCDSSSAELWNSSSAILCDSSSAILHNSSSAILYNSSSAILCDSSSAKLYNNSSAKLCDSSICRRYSKNSKISNIDGDAICIYGYSILVSDINKFQMEEFKSDDKNGE